MYLYRMMAPSAPMLFHSNSFLSNKPSNNQLRMYENGLIAPRSSARHPVNQKLLPEDGWASKRSELAMDPSRMDPTEFGIKFGKRTAVHPVSELGIRFGKRQFARDSARFIVYY